MRRRGDDRQAKVFSLGVVFSGRLFIAFAGSHPLRQHSVALRLREVTFGVESHLLIPESPHADLPVLSFDNLGDTAAYALP
jgi:hypothetical protein